VDIRLLLTSVEKYQRENISEKMISLGIVAASVLSANEVHADIMSTSHHNCDRSQADFSSAPGARGCCSQDPSKPARPQAQRDEQIQDRFGTKLRR